MAEVSLNIHGHAYGVSCDDGQESRVAELGRYIDHRLREMAAAGAAASESHLLVLTGLMLADEIYELREALHKTEEALSTITDRAETRSSSGLSAEDEQAAVEILASLADRIGSVTTRLKQAA
ncbi:MAG: cell division protein ZapA [Alphaproteobacteria bacterium]|nr:cell division protein ZapA [Alphaproteobacteria bacterium]